MNRPLKDTGREARLQLLRAQEAATRARILALFPEEQAAIAQWRDTLPVALVLGAPRGGTSAFRASLASHGEILAPAGEHRLFFSLLGLNFPDSGDEAETANRPLSPALAAEILDMILLTSAEGPAVGRPDEREALRYAWEWAYRLPLQWTRIDFVADDVVRIVLEAVRAFRAADSADPAQLDRLVLQALSAAYPLIDAQYYDGFPASGSALWTEALREAFDPIIEITPFVIPRPRRLKTPQSRVRMLLLKASSDAYRMITLRSLFRDRPVHVLRLTRNPLAAINGLLDGWAHHCFWQHDLTNSLGAASPFAGWCFDLVDDWQNLAAEGQLLPIVMQQWLEPNRLIEEARHKRATNEHWHSFDFEAFVSSPESRRHLLERSVQALGLEPDENLSRAGSAPPRVNVTRPSASGRWRKRSAELLPLAENPRILGMAAALGYDRRGIDGWI